MFCCNNGNQCNNRNQGLGYITPACPRLNYVVTVGPQGPQGATGPQGPQGPAGVNDAVYASAGAQTVATDAIIPVALNAATPTTTMTVSGNAVNVAAGTYLVTFGFNGQTNSNASPTSVQLYANGTAVSGEVVANQSTDTNDASGQKTLIYTATAATALSLYNVSDNSSTFSNAGITVIKLA